MFARLVVYTSRRTPVPCSQRAYSFFSSKAGGGRYFNSAKPPNSSSKVVAPAGKAKAESASGDDAVKPPPSSSGGIEEASAKEVYNSASWKPAASVEPVQHAQITPHDLNLHNFFSLHRPLLLLSQSTSTLFESPATVNFTAQPQNNAHVGPSAPEGMGNFEDVPEASPEADADAARLLARSLVINRLGATVSWENTLKQLGLDVDEGREEEREALMDAFEAYMDSTKRKRRRKMKKHKCVVNYL
jgi:hypothetical protein